MVTQCVATSEEGDVSGGGPCLLLSAVLAASGACPEIAARAMDDDDPSALIKNGSTDSCLGPIVNYYDYRIYAIDPGTDWPKSIPEP